MNVELPCWDCGLTKPVGDFYPSRLKISSKKTSLCKKCEIKKNSGYANKYQEKMRALGLWSYRRTPHRWKYNTMKVRAKIKGWPFLITKDEFELWYRNQEQKCSYCDLIDLSLYQPFHRSKIFHFTIDRKNNDLPYTIENICFACWACNRAKGELFGAEEFREIAQKYIKPKWLKKLDRVQS